MILEKLKEEILANYGSGGDPETECPYKLDVPCSAIETSDTYRTFDGSCNNRKNPLYGRALTPFTRAIPPDYDNSKTLIRQE